MHHSVLASCAVAPSQSAPLSEGLGLVHVLVFNRTPPPQGRVHSPGPINAVNPPFVPWECFAVFLNQEFVHSFWQHRYGSGGADDDGVGDFNSDNDNFLW